MNPTDSSRRFISRNGSGLSRPNLNLDNTNLWQSSGAWLVEVKFQRLLQVGECLFLAFALTGDVHFDALGDVPVTFTPNCRSERALHTRILSLYFIAWRASSNTRFA